MLYILALYYVIKSIIKICIKNNINKKEFTYKNNPLTETEKNFIKTIKPFTDKNDLIILSQVPLQAIFKTNNQSNFNRIKAKTIDFALVDNNYNYKGFIELDDYTHNRQDRIKRDNFVNQLFAINNIKLKRIKVAKEYNLIDIDKYIKEITNQATSLNSNGLK
jgi:hypothetical protein